MKCQAITKSGAQCSRDAVSGTKFCWQHQGNEIIENDSLTDKQKAFCEEYIIDNNATRAAIAAGYSKNGARQTAHNLLTNTDIKAEIDRLREARSKRTEITADRVLEELAKIGFSNIKDYLQVKDFEVITGYKNDKNGNPDKSKSITKTIRGVEIFETDNLDDDITAAIAEIKQTRSGISLKLHDKLKALEDIGKHLGMFSENVNVNVTGVEIIDDIE